MKEQRKNALIIFIVSILISGIPALVLNTPVVLDEVGTLSNSAYLAGYDWKSVVEGTGGYYYKYGQVVLYAPLFFIINNPYILYKMMLFVNAILVSIIPVIAYRICKTHLGVRENYKAAAISIAVFLLPSVLLYSEYARGDVILLVAPWLVLWSLLEAMEQKENGTKRKQIVYSVLVAFFSVFAYMAHTRGIVIIIATVLLVVLAKMIKRKMVVHGIAYSSATVIFFMFDRVLTKYFKLAIWGAEGRKHASVESFSFESLLLIFTPAGFKSFVKLITGWAFSALTSTNGLIVIGMCVAIGLLILVFKNKNQVSDDEFVCGLFGTLIFGGTYAMGILFFFPYVHEVYIGESLKRIDRLIYDRYLVAGIGILCFLALYALLVRKEWIKRWTKIVSTITFLAVLFVTWVKIAPLLGKGYLSVRNFIGLNTFVTIPYGENSIKSETLSKELLVLGICAFGIMIVFFVLQGLKKDKLIIGLVTFTFLAGFITNYAKVRYPIDERNYNYVKESVSFMSQVNELAEEFPYVMTDKKASSERPYYFLFKEWQVVRSNWKKTLEIDNMFMILNRDNINYDFYEDDYYQIADYPYDGESANVVYVKGEELNKRLNEMGISTVKVIRE